jgi:hypothetical protein
MPFSLCSVTIHALGDVVGHQGRNADAEVHVEAVLQLAGGAGGHLVTGPGHVLYALPPSSLRTGALLDALLVVRALHDAVDEDARRVDVVGVELPGHHALHLGDA